MSQGLLASLIESKEVVKVSCSMNNLHVEMFRCLKIIINVQVLHDSKNDSAALNLGWNVKLENVFDTQV